MVNGDGNENDEKQTKTKTKTKISRSNWQKKIFGRAAQFLVYFYAVVVAA